MSSWYTYCVVLTFILSRISSSFSISSTEIISLKTEIKLKQSLIIYYAAMDELSQWLFNTTLATIFDEFFPFVNFVFIPFKNTIIVEGDLYCSNLIDPNCYTDTVHACAIAQIEDKRILYKFLSCTMKSTYTLPDIAACTKSIDWDISRLESCFKSDVGKRLAWQIIKGNRPMCPATPCYIFADDEDITSNSYKNVDNFACISNLEDTICAKLRTKQHNIPFSLLPSNCTKSLTIEIFYKAMNEASQSLIKSLAPIYDKFAAFYDFQFNPCMFSELGKDNSLKCGEENYIDKDCKAEIVQICAINVVGKNNPLGLFGFLKCTMIDHTKMPNFEKCAADNHINFSHINECVESGKGTYLCYENGKRYFDGNPPAVVFDFLFREIESEKAKENIQLTLCQHLKALNLTYPEECRANLKLTVFFHAMELEFQNWARSNLAEMYTMFSPFIDFELISCRNVEAIESDKLNIKCTNSMDSECYADKFLACAKNVLKDDIDSLVKLILCLNRDYCGNLPLYDHCAKSIDLDPSSINICANGTDGVKFCLENLEKNPKSDLRIAFQVNDKWDEVLSDEIQYEYSAPLCDCLQDEKFSFPNECYDLM